MALPPTLRGNFSPLELDFVAEEEIVEIVPSIRLPKTRLLSGVSAKHQSTRLLSKQGLIVDMIFIPTILPTLRP